jgi:hypothetical protein
MLFSKILSLGHLEIRWRWLCKTLCGFPSIKGAISNTHFSNSKPNGTFCENYFYHKTRRYNVVCQAIVDDQKKFTNIFVGLPRSVNDSKNFKRFVTYYFVQFQGFFNANKG